MLTVTWAQRPQTTFPAVVTRPSSDTEGWCQGVFMVTKEKNGKGEKGKGGIPLTSIIVPLVKTPSCVYIGFCGFCRQGGDVSRRDSE